LEVAFLSTWRAQCGIATYTANLKAALDAAGVGTDVEPIDRKRVYYLTRPELREHFRRLAHNLRHADVAHLQHEFALYAGGYGYAVSTAVLRAVVLELARLRKPTVITLHTDPFGMFGREKDAFVLGHNTYLKALWRARMAPLFRTTGLEAIVHTPAARRAAVDSGVPASRIEVIRHGVPSRPSLSDADRQEVRSRLGYGPEVKVLAVFGFLEAYKGYTTAIECLSRLPEDYHLAIVGGVHPFSWSPATESILKQLERRPALKGRVTVRGFVPASELAAYQEAADVCLAPYKRGTPLSASGSVTWALASGKPVIASALPAFIELRDYIDCLEVVAPDSPRELAHAVERLASDPDRVQQLVFQAHRYCSVHSWEATARTHAQLYERLARSRSPLGGRLARAGPARARQALSRGRARALRRRAQVEADGFVYLPLGVGASHVTFAVDPDSDDQIVQELINGGYPSEPGALLMQAFLRPGDVVVDLGAHVGTYALAAAARGCRVVAIEANPDYVRALRAAVARNQFANVTVVHGAVSSHGGSVNFVCNRIWGHVVSNGSDPGDGTSCVEVAAIPIAPLLDQLGVERVDFIKMDVEGSEPAAIEGMVPLLERDDAPVILFESNATVLRDVAGVSYEDLHRRLEELGFGLYVVDLERVGRLVPVKAGDFMPHAVLEYLAAKRLPDEIFPWSVADPFTREELTRRVVTASSLEAVGYRAYAASVIAAGPEWLRRDPRVESARARLLGDDSAEVREVLTAR
jgi:FkbM family methyltransferase